MSDLSVAQEFLCYFYFQTKKVYFDIQAYPIGMNYLFCANLVRVNNLSFLQSQFEKIVVE